MDCINLEDTIFILNIRIRMLKDTLRLHSLPGLFLERCIEDLAFIDRVLDEFSRMTLESGGGYFDYISDAEWQFNQLLTEFALDSSPFPAAAFPEVRNKITALRDSSDARRKTLEESSLFVEIARTEPVVSSAELSGLLGGI